MQPDPRFAESGEAIWLPRSPTAREVVMKTLGSILLSVGLSLSASPSLAAFDSGSTGADGAFNPTVSTSRIDLSLAGTGPGTGTYDAARWAVIFNYTTINVPAGVQVTFSNHPSGAPVVWLASGDATISGGVSLEGQSGGSNTFAPPGPGGFAGGRGPFGGRPETAGFGPGGGGVRTPSTFGSGAGHATPGAGTLGGGTYGNPQIVPLIGGSGGSAGVAAGYYAGDGGAGGGAILLACSGRISLNGGISANGGNGAGSGDYFPTRCAGGGSGGAIRLLASEITGLGSLNAAGGSAGFCGSNGGEGRIRVEASSIDLDIIHSNPPWTFSLTPGPVFPDPTWPTLTATLIMGQPVPQDPLAGIETLDVVVTDSTAVTVNIVATNIPEGTIVDVILTPAGGPADTVQSTPLAGTLALSTATASVTIPRTLNTEVFLRANYGGAMATGRAATRRRQ